MRLGLAVLLLALGGMTASAAPMRMPRCLGPDAWDTIAKCVKEDSPQWANVVSLSEHVRAVTDPAHTSGRLYVQELDGRWRNQRGFAANLQVVSDAATTLDTVKVRRVELREVIDYGNRTQIRMKSAAVCGVEGVGACQLRSYECEAIAGGRGIGLVKGEVRIVNGMLAVVADRSHAGGLCEIP